MNPESPIAPVASARYGPLAIALLLQLGATFYFVHHVQSREEARLRLEVSRRAAHATKGMEVALKRDLALLDAVGALISMRDVKSREDFEQFVERSEANGDHTRAVEWIPRIQHADRRPFESEWSLQITQVSPDGGIVPATRREEYFPVTFAAPLRGNEAALGFDLGSTPNRRAALDRARDQGSKATTAPIKLVQDASGLSVLVLKPVYSNDLSSDSLAERRRHLTGYVAGVYGVDHLAHAAEALAEEVEFVLRDVSDPLATQLLYTTSGFESADPKMGRSVQAVVEVPGRRWLLEYRPTPELCAQFGPEQARQIVLIALAYSLILICGLALYFAWLLKSTMRLERARAELVASQEALHKQNLFLDAVLENMPNMVFVKDAKDLRFVRFNRAGEELLGRTERELLGKNDYDFFPDDQADFFAEKDRKVIANMQMIDIPEEPIDSPRLGKRWLHTKKMPLCVHGDQPEFLLGISEDITTTKRFQDELRRSNAELEQFAYVASHDLQEPLRMVSSYTQILEDRYADQLDEDAVRYLRYARDGAQRMQRLVKDLLKLSRVSHGVHHAKPLRTGQIVDQVLADLAHEVSEKKAEVEVEVLPDISGDSGQIAQLFQNLLTNALKYCEQGTPKIRVGSVIESDKVCFFVRDNGIGVDVRHWDRIFQPFQRLHSRDAYEGSGIGLAVAKKIVERHGGELWVESAEGEGSTFRFTIPLQAVDVARMKGLAGAESRN